jgi:hypothetical protein
MFAKLEVILEDDGQIRVTWSRWDLVLCYGMLELARTAITDHAKALQPRIASPTPADVLQLRSRNGT